MKIPIGNLYYIFAYACGLMRPGRDVEVGSETSPDVLDLLARILVDQTRTILRRGLAHDYLTFEEELASLRGRVNVQSSIVRQTRTRGRLACIYDELDIDRPFNQVLKATAKALLDRRGVAQDRRSDLAGIVGALRRVSTVRPDRQLIRRIQIQGDLRRYRGALAVCTLVLTALLPSEAGGGSRFSEILRDDERMATVFEEFLRNFYRLEQAQFDVRKEVMTWDFSAEVQSAALLPVMRTDMTLRSPARIIVADAKYYANAFSGAGEQPKLHSSHLYQLFAYVEHARRPSMVPVDGLLIYPVTDTPLSAQFSIRGHGMRAEGIDLLQPWPAIRNKLLTFLDPVKTS